VPTRLFKDLVKIAPSFILLCPSFAQKNPFALRSGDPGNDARKCRG
jgi:hypothetical protein